MNKKNRNILEKLIKQGISEDHLRMIEKEMNLQLKRRTIVHPSGKLLIKGLYDINDIDLFWGKPDFKEDNSVSLQTLDDLLVRDKKREQDGFPRRIKIGKYIKPSKDKKEKVVVVPTTTEPKFYHDNSVTDEEETTGGSGDGEEGEVIAESPAEPQPGEGEGQGAGQGDSGDHEIGSDAFDIGKILTEKFQLPNLKPKGKKRSTTKYQYDLTDKHRGFGQILDKKATLKRIVETNILLGNVPENKEVQPEDLIINPQDQVFMIMSKEKDFESQAVVFFVRDYSGSMQGKPTEVIVTQHLFIFSWLMYQYQNNVQARFIVHDTEAKEVPDFYTYYKSMVAGGTNIYPAYDLVNSIVEKEQLAKDNNIYVFHGTDGDDWEENGEKAVDALKKMILYSSRVGITIAKNSWTSAETDTIVEKYMESSGLLKSKHDLIRLYTMIAENATESMIIEGIRKLIN